MVQTPSKPLTLEEFLKLPETKPANEYIDGQIIHKPMPQGKHSTIQTELSAAINAVLKPLRVARAFSELRSGQTHLNFTRSNARFCGACPVRTRARIFFKGDIQGPMQTILNAPMETDSLP